MEEPVSNVVMIDDQVSYADAFGLALSITPDFELVGRADDGPTGVEICLGVRPDLVVCDYRLPDGDTGTQVADRLRRSGFTAPILVLTGYLAPQVRRETEALAAVQAMSKDTPLQGIVEAMRAMLRGDAVAGSASAEQDPSEQSLSPGELEVLELLNQGSNPTEIAQQLHLSLHTIRARIKSMHRKLDVASQVEAIAAATRLGLLVPPN